jgi:hypothetical protein
MPFRSIEEARKLKRAYSPKYKVYVTIEDVWKNANGQTCYLCHADSNTGFGGDYAKKIFLGTELSGFTTK